MALDVICTLVINLAVSLLSRVGGDGNVKSESQCTVHGGPYSMETTNMMSNDKDTAKLITRVHMTSRAIQGDRGGGLKYNRGWFETLDDMEVQVLAMCNGTKSIQDMLGKVHRGQRGR